MGSLLVQWLDSRYSPLLGARPGCQTRDSYANRGLPWWLSGKGSPCNAGVTVVMDLIPKSERSPWGGHDNPLQYSCLEKPMDHEAWWATVHRVAKNQTRLKRLHRQRLHGTVSVSLSPFCSKNAVSWLISLQEKDGKNHWFGDWWLCICICMYTCVCRCIIHLLDVIHYYLTEFLSKNRLRWKRLEQEVCKLDILIYDKIQYDLGLFPRQTIQYHSNPSLCPNHYWQRS